MGVLAVASGDLAAAPKLAGVQPASRASAGRATRHACPRRTA